MCVRVWIRMKGTSRWRGEERGSHDERGPTVPHLLSPVCVCGRWEGLAVCAQGEDVSEEGGES